MNLRWPTGSWKKRWYFTRTSEVSATDILLPWANLHRAEGDIKGAVRLYRTALAALGNDRGSGRNLLLLDLATVANALDQDELTAHLLGASDAQDKEVRRLWPIERVDYDHLAEAARARLGAERFHAASIQGRD